MTVSEYITFDFVKWQQRRDSLISWIDKNQPELSDFIHDQTIKGGQNYLTAIDFSFENRKVTRYGLIALIRLEPFEKGVVLPHEKTFSGVRSERLELMKACRANLSSIFSLYADRNHVFDLLKEAALKKGRQPVISVISVVNSTFKEFIKIILKRIRRM